MKSRNLPFSVSPAPLAGVAALCSAVPARAAVAVAAPVSEPAPVPASRPTAAIPPDLAALEQQMSKLDATSERFSIILDLGSVNFGGVPLEFVFGASGESAYRRGPATPSRLARAGKQGATTRQHHLYLRTLIAKYDGQRPWVRGQRINSLHSFGAGANPLVSTAPSGGGASSPA